MTLKAFTNYLWAGVGTGKGLEMIYLEVMPESPSVMGVMCPDPGSVLPNCVTQGKSPCLPCLKSPSVNGSG